MFGDNLRKYRLAKGYSQSELARILYVTRQCISKWEKGITQPDMDTLIRISGLLEVSINTLLGAEAGTNKMKSMEANVCFLLVNVLIALFFTIDFFILLRFVPKIIPLHWTNGKIDRYGSRAELLINLFAVVAFLVAGILSFIIFKHAKVEKVVIIAIAHGVTIVAQIAFYIYIIIIYSRYITAYYSFITCMCANMILCISIVMHPKISKQNHFIGIRTTATIKSETVWKKTNALGCYLFVICSMSILIINMILIFKFCFLSLLLYLVPAVAVIVYSKCISKINSEDGLGHKSI